MKRGKGWSEKHSSCAGFLLIPQQVLSSLCSWVKAALSTVTRLQPKPALRRDYSHGRIRSSQLLRSLLQLCIAAITPNYCHSLLEGLWCHYLLWQPLSARPHDSSAQAVLPAPACCFLSWLGEGQGIGRPLGRLCTGGDGQRRCSWLLSPLSLALLSALALMTGLSFCRVDPHHGQV